MTLLWKKLAGLGSALLGGLTAAHGGAMGQAWEVLVGLALIVAGAALLSGKIVRRNEPP